MGAPQHHVPLLVGSLVVFFLAVSPLLVAGNWVNNVIFKPLDPNVTNPTDLFLEIDNPLIKTYCEQGQIYNPDGKVDPSPGPFPFDIFYEIFNPNVSAVPTNIWQKNLWGFEFNNTGTWNGVYAYPYIVTAKVNTVTFMYPGLPGNVYAKPPQPVNSRVSYQIIEMSLDANVTGAEYPLLVMSEAWDFGVYIANGNYPRIVAVDDLSATIEFAHVKGGPAVATFYVVKGSPYINIECVGAELGLGSSIPGVPPVISLNNQPPGSTVTGSTFTATAAVGAPHLAGQTWHLFFDSEVTIDFLPAPQNPTLSAPYTGLLQVACGELNDVMGPILAQYAGVYAQGGKVSYDINDASSLARVNFNWNVGFASGTQRTADDLLMLTLPHHTHVISPLQGQAPPVSTPYWTVNGNMSMMVGSVWSMPYNLTNVGWGDNLVPNPADVPEITAQLAFDYAMYVNSCPGDNPANASQPGWVNVEFYAYFRDLAKYQDLAAIAASLGETDMVEGLTQRIAYCLQPALWKQKVPPQPCPPSLNNSDTCVGNQMAMYYDHTWGGIITSWFNRFAVQYCEGCQNPTGFYPLANYGNSLYNDHHFQYGYFVRCAAWVIYQAGKGVDVNMTSEAIDTLKLQTLAFARDYANPNVTTDKWFPSVRHKDHYDGHSWAEGYDYSGRVFAWVNQEGGGEAINAYYSLYLLGHTLEDQNIVDFARIMLATEQESVRTYQHLKTNEPEVPYAPLNEFMRCMPMLQGTGQTGTTFYGPQALFDCGAGILPFTPITSEWIDPTWASEAFAWMQMKNNMSGICQFPDPLTDHINICPGNNNPATFWANEWECCPYNIPQYADNIYNAYPNWFPLMYLIQGINDTNAAWENLQVKSLELPTEALPFPYVNSNGTAVGYFDGISRSQALWFLSTLSTRSSSVETGKKANPIKITN